MKHYYKRLLPPEALHHKSAKVNGMRNKGLHILIKPNPLQSVSCSPRGTSTCDLPRLWPLSFITPCVKIIPPFWACQAAGEGSGAVWHTRNAEFRVWPFGSGIAAGAWSRAGLGAAGWGHPLRRLWMERWIQHFSSQNMRPGSALPSPSGSGRIFF